MGWIKKICLVLMAVLILEGAYCLATWVFLNTKVFDQIVSLDSDELIIRIHHGKTWIPGRIHVDSIEILGEDPNVRWKVMVEDVDIELQLRKLIRKRLEFKSLVASRVAFDLQLKSPREKRAYPQKPVVPVEEKRKTHWSLGFEKISLKRVLRLQVADFFYEGDAHIQGKFYIWPGIEAEVGPASLVIDSGKLSSQAQPSSICLMSDMKGRFQVQFDLFPSYKITGSEVLRYLSAAGELNSAVASVRGLNRFFLKTPQIFLDKGKGHLSAVARIQKGRITRPTQLTVSSDQIEIAAYRLKASGRGRVHGFVGSDAAQLSVKLEPFAVTSREQKDGDLRKTLFQGKELYVRAQSPDLDLMRAFSRLKFQLWIPKSRLPSLKDWSPVMMDWVPEFKFQGGKGTFQAFLTADTYESEANERPTGFIQFNLQNVNARLKGGQIQGEFASEFHLTPIHLNTSKAQITQADIRLKPVHWRVQSGLSRVDYHDWWTDLHLEGVHFGFSERPFVLGKAQIRSKNTDPVIEYFRQNLALSSWKGRLLRVEPLVVSSQFAINPEGLKLTQFNLDSRRLKVDGNAMFLSQGNVGTFKLKYGLMTLGIRLIGSETQVRLFPSQDWLNASPLR